MLKSFFGNKQVARKQPTFETVRVENIEFVTRYPLHVKWLEYKNGDPCLVWFYDYLVAGREATGWWQADRECNSREILQIASGVYFPRNIEEAASKLSDEELKERTDYSIKIIYGIVTSS